MLKLDKEVKYAIPKFRVTLPPDSKMRIRRIENVEAII
jgi:hypothetical protein